MYAGAYLLCTPGPTYYVCRGLLIYTQGLLDQYAGGFFQVHQRGLQYRSYQFDSRGKLKVTHVEMPI